jgi:hypothetical protein
MLLTGCITYPYQTAFDSCDAEAGACYRYCEDVAASDYELGACHNECDNDANQCFASAYDSYSYDGSAYGGAYSQPSWPWYGRYGAWGPGSGFYFDFSYYGGSHGYDRPRRGRGHGGGRGGRGGGYGGGSQGSGGQGSGNPPNDGGGQRPPRGPRGGEDVDQTGDYPTPNRKDRIAPPLRRREAPPQNTTPPTSRRAAPAQNTTPPPAQQAAPSPQTAPQPAPQQPQSAPAQQPAKPKTERGTPRGSQPEDY